MAKTKRPQRCSQCRQYFAFAKPLELTDQLRGKTYYFCTYLCVSYWAQNHA